MTLLEAIDQRTSVRRYTDQIIEESKISEIKKAIRKYNREAGLSIEFLEDGSAAFSSFLHTMGRFSGVKSLILLKGKTDVEDLKEKLGRYGELILLQALSLGLGSCWVSGSMNRKCAELQVADGEQLAAVITLGYARTSRPADMINNLKHKKSLKKLYISDSTPPEWFLAGVQAARRAPSALNLQPVKFFYINGVVLASVRKIHKPQLMDLGIAKSHFELAADGRFDYGNGGLLVRQQQE